MTTKAQDRTCKQCRKGTIYPRGRAPDGRPEYACSYCRKTHTNGHDGYPWDPRTKLEVAP